jgi:TonB family protein
MTSSRILLLAVTLPLFSSAALGSNKETEAASLIERARQLSDIRTEDSPAFRLKLNFKAIKGDGSVLEGTYTEVWVSKTQWRRETVVGDIRRTEVAAGQKRFLLEPVKALPEHIRDLPALSETGRFQPEAWKPEKIENRKLDGSSVRCVETKPVVRAGFHLLITREPEGWSEAPSLCFDRSSGVLAAEIEPAMNRSQDEACFWSDYQKFGDRLYPRAYKCMEGEQPRLEARVLEFVALPQADPEMFALPNGAKELTSCPDPVRVPRAVYEPEPAGAPVSGVVVISIIVSFDGRPRDLNIVSSPNPKLEKRALEAVRQWRFRPATCDREPVEAKIAVEIANHVQ